MTKADIRFYLPFFVVFCLSLVYHLRMHPMGGDDPFFATALEGTTLRQYLAGRYEYWTSRIVLEALLVLIIKAPWLWRLLNLLAFASLPVLFTRLFGTKNVLSAWGAAGAVLLFPFHDMGTAGWITTTETHFWPLWGILFLAVQLRHIVMREKMTPLAAAAGIPVCMVTGSHEQYAVILLVLLVLCGVFCFVRRKEMEGRMAVTARMLFCSYGLICILSLLVIAACPGNAARNAVSLADLPIYRTFGFGDKLYLGLLGIERVFIANADIAFFTVTLVLAALVYVKTGHYIKTLVSAVPFLILVGQTVIRTAFPGFSSLFPVPGEILEWSWNELTTWIPMGYLALTVGTMIFALYQLFGENLLEYIFILLLLGCGFGAGAVVGFMATIYVSGERVYAALYMILLLVALWAVHKMRAPLQERVKTTAGKLFVTFLALLCCSNILFELLSIG